MIRLVTEFSEHKRKIEDDLSDMTTLIIEHIIISNSVINN